MAPQMAWSLMAPQKREAAAAAAAYYRREMGAHGA